MPMIDVYAASGTFADTRRLTIDLATAVMTIEGVPNIPMFRQNTAAFIHELGNDCLANVDGDNSYVRVQVLTNAVSTRPRKAVGGSGTTHCHRRRCGWRSDAGRPDMGAPH